MGKKPVRRKPKEPADRKRPGNPGTLGWRKFTEDQVIAALVAARGFKSAAAKVLGCDRWTIEAYEQDSERVRETIREQRELMSDVAESGLYHCLMQREPWALRFYLSTRCKDRGYVLRTELSGDPDNPLGGTPAVVVYLPDNGRGMPEGV